MKKTNMKPCVTDSECGDFITDEQSRRVITMKKLLAFLIIPALAVALSAGAAMANGTLAATFIYNGSGASQPLAGAYAYLHAYPYGTFIAEKYFRRAQYILGPSDSNGNFSVSVPDGKYRIMLMRRAPIGGGNISLEYGPPRPGDYTWIDTGAYITVTDGATVNLGTVYATVFSQPITVKGTVTACTWTNNSATGQYYCAPGAAEANYFVFATTTPCPSRLNTVDGGAEWNCGQVFPKYASSTPTDANGNYTLHLQNPGTYYIYSNQNPGQYGSKLSKLSRHGARPCGPITSNSSMIESGSTGSGAGYVNPVTVTAGGTFNVNCAWF